MCVLDHDTLQYGKRELIILGTEIVDGCVASMFGRCSCPDDGGSKLLIVKIIN